VIVRNERGRELIDAIRSVSQLESQPPSGRAGVLKRQSLVVQTVVADDEAKCGQGPTEGAPRWLGEVLAWVLTGLGPTGIDFAKYSIEYHYLRNYIHVMRHWNGKAAEKHIPEYVNRIVKYYDEKTGGLISKRASLTAPFPGAKIKVKK
jgi:7-hydroxymethyl chlorophyll a reductase